MGFVNEYVSDEDIKKYDLNGIWDKYHPLWKGDYYLGERPSWTIDRDQNVFLMPLKIGGRGTGNRVKFLLWCDGAFVVISVDLSRDSSSELDAVPFKRVWELVSINPSSSIKFSAKEILRIFKEALVAYGYWGARKQIPNTVVEFRF